MSDDDIEFLDEDAEIVQQCVLSVHPQLTIKVEPDQEQEPAPHVIQNTTPESLLVERPSLLIEKSTGKKRKKEDDDTDYDPTIDSPHYRKRRYNGPKTLGVRKYETSSRSSQQSQSPPLRKAAIPRTQVNRREMTIRIPDFDDPLCLPVRALVKDENDARRLKQWNKLCLEQFQNKDTPLRPRKGVVTSSKRTTVIRNQFNKYSGKTETTFWSKILVANKSGETESEVIHSVLPRYREKKILTAYTLADGKKQKRVNEHHEVILTKEIHGDEETLVAYKPESSLAMVFKMFESELVDIPEEDRRYLLEMASCVACARCYQASWRPREKNLAAREQMLAKCPVCARACSSAGALVAHARTHSPDEVRAHRSSFCDILVKLLPYQYTCRVCQQQFGAVRDLRRHLLTHKGSGEFYCEIGNHTVS